ncbi:MAG: hypothetical protein LBB22_06870 [Treponema sp.]|nr:hypothetical protein [Treponema sp.]
MLRLDTVLSGAALTQTEDSFVDILLWVEWVVKGISGFVHILVLLTAPRFR